MDSQPTSPAAPDWLDATLHNNNAVSPGAGQEETISGPTNVLEESSHPLQGTALQGLLTLPDDDHTPVPATICLSLPRELVEHILLLLDTKTVLRCRLVNREFNAIIQSSTLVQYYLACKAAGVVDNPQSPLSYIERFEALKKREDAWRNLKPVFETTIKKVIAPLTDYWGRAKELTSGYYFGSDNDMEDLYYCHLPSTPEDNPEWLGISGYHPGQRWSGSILDMGMAIFEHDLIVSVTSSEVGNQAVIQRSIDLILLKFSTGEHHPLACHPLIQVQKSPSSRRALVSVKIVGDNLALVVHDQEGSKLFVFDWKTGHKRLHHKASENAYEESIPVFVSPELLLVPNRTLSHFEVWHLFPSHHNPKPPVQILSLRIPALSANYSIIGIHCYGEPSPFLHSMPYFPPRSFFPSSEDSIIMVNFCFGSESLAEPQPSPYKLIMHRRALLDMIQKWTSPSRLEQQEGLPTWSTTEVIEHKIADMDDGSVILGAQSNLVSMKPHLRFSSSVSSGSASSTSRYNILQVQWADWGPSISRWLQLGGQSTGQRFVFLDRNPRDKKKGTICVADFNLHNVRRNAEMMAQLRGEGEDNGGNNGNNEGKKEDNVDELEILDHEGVFSEEVYMGLKCVVYRTPGEYDFHIVWMDDERLLGFKYNMQYSMIESIKVLYFG